MNFQVSFDISLTKPSQKEGCFIVTSLQWPRWYFRVLLLIMSRFRHLEKPIKTKENKRKHFVFICFYWFCLVFLEGESKSPHRLQVYLLPLEGVRGVDPSLWEGLGGLLLGFYSPPPPSSSSPSPPAVAPVALPSGTRNDSTLEP